MDLGLDQREVAERLGVHAASVRNWELGRTVPGLRGLPAVIEFVGYDPRSEPTTIGAKIKTWRTARGLSQEEMARRLDVDPSTLARWESGEQEPPGEFRERTSVSFSRK